MVLRILYALLIPSAAAPAEDYSAPVEIFWVFAVVPIVRRTKGFTLAHGAILELVNYLELKEILKPATAARGEDPSEAFREQITKPSSQDPGSRPAVARAPSGATSQLASDDSSDFVEVSPDTLLELPDASPAVVSTQGQQSAELNVATTGTGPEITIVIDDKVPGAQKRVIVIPQASAWMLEMLTGEAAAGRTLADTTTLRPVRVTANTMR